MAFAQALSDRLDNIMRKVKGVGKLSEKNVTDAVRDVQIALLEADVHFSVVKTFINSVKAKAFGEEVLKSVTPGQMFIKILNDELINILGNEPADWDFESKLPHKILMAGLQGSGKTTTAAKLAKYILQKKELKIMFAGGDVVRPAAGLQLKKLGDKLGITTVLPEKTEKLSNFAKRINQEFNDAGYDILVFDTAGRMEINEDMMDEIVTVKSIIEPDSIFLVLDAMTGQQSAQVAKVFSEKISVNGAVLSKLDSDARGGAALSFRQITGMPVYFYGTGEKIDDLEIFYPNRIASRILGMGDVVSLVEKAAENIDQEKAMKLQKKLRKNDFDFQDFLEQLEQVQKIGSLQDIMKYLPGFSSKKMTKNVNFSGKEFDRVKAIIQSMTVKEKLNPDILNGRRRRRIATGSGTNPQEVNNVIKQFFTMKKMIKQMNNGMLGNLGNLAGKFF